MQQGDSLALLPGFSSQLSQPTQPQDHHNRPNGYGDGTPIDTSFPAYQNATTQPLFVPDTTWNTAIQTHSGITPVIDNNLYCIWPGCRQSQKEYTTAELKFAPSIHIFPRFRR
jgi:hypothetical protein